MIPAAFDYVRAETLEEALEAIASGDEIKVIAGGQSLLPLMRWRLAQPAKLVDIGRLSEIQAITNDGGTLVIGGGATWRAIFESDVVRGGWLGLLEVLKRIGDVQVRNVGTIGGGLAHADPASDMPAALLALGASMTLKSAGLEREVAAADFFKGPFETALEQAELLTAVRVPPLPAGAGTAYVGFDQPASGFAIAAAFALVTGGAATISFTGVSGAPFLVTGLSKESGDEEIAAAVDAALEGREVNADIHASADYRRHIAKVAAKRALRTAARR